MRLMTLNTHSLVGEDFSRRAAEFLAALPRQDADVIALQEVNQTADAAPLPEGALIDFVPCGGDRPLRQDNYAAQIAGALREAGKRYFWTWLPVKRGYGRYDEGLAFFSRRPIVRAESFWISRSQDYENWRSRKALVIGTAGEDTLFCNLHMSWWRDPDEPFLPQWERVRHRFADAPRVWLMGDFNNPPHVRGEGYDRILLSGWYDSYLHASVRFGEETVRGEIDGWRGQATGKDRLRIDQIWCNRRPAIRSYRTVFNGWDEPVVSDHFGVLVTVCDTETPEKKENEQ